MVFLKYINYVFSLSIHYVTRAKIADFIQFLQTPHRFGATLMPADKFDL